MNQLLAVFTYEWKRTLTAGRMGWWLALTAFPAAIVLLLRCQAEFGRGMQQQQIDAVWSVVLYMLIPCVCCALGVFLNAAPAIASELEQRSWVYLATRPRGILWLLLGKYLVAVVWAVTSALVSSTLAVVLTEADLSLVGVRSPVENQTTEVPAVVPAAVPVAATSVAATAGQLAAPQRPPLPPPPRPPRPGGRDVAAVAQPLPASQGTRPSADSEGARTAVRWRLWWTMLRLSCLSAMSYAALYLLIGAVFPRRAMVFCVAYTALVEVVLSLIPAIINRLTIQYRLRSLMMNWAEPAGREQMQDNIFFRYVFAEGGNVEQMLWLTGLTVLFLVVAILAGHLSEFTNASESDV